MAELSYTLGTIRTDAPIDTAEGAYAVGEGNKAEAVRLMQELELHSLIARFGLSDITPAADPERVPAEPLPEAELAALPLSRRAITSWRAARCHGQAGRPHRGAAAAVWYAVQDKTVFPLESEDLLRLLDNKDVTLDVFDSAPLSPAPWLRAAGAAASSGTASWLLSAGRLRLQVPDQRADPRLQGRCRLYLHRLPGRGRLADLFARMKAEITACGEDALYNEIEFPLAQVLADMTRTGVLVDKDGIEQFGVKLREELEQVLTRIHMETGSATFNPNSPKQLGEMLFDTMGLPHGKKTQRGWSTDAETLESLREYPLVEDVLQYRAYQKLNSTYVEVCSRSLARTGASTPPLTRPKPAPDGSPPIIPTCRISPSAPSWAVSCAPTLLQSRAVCWWTRITARSSCASWRTSPGTSTCSRPF